MKNIISRRKFVAGLTTLSSLFLTGCKDRFFPPNFNGIFGISDSLTMSAQRLLMTEQTMAPEYTLEEISPEFPTNGTVLPEGEAYQGYMANNFEDWRLSIGGLVNTPLSLSMADIKSFPSRMQITSQSCEAGWTAIAQWKGVPLSYVLQLAGLKENARYIHFRCEDWWYDSIDMFDALHAQTILAYEMNGEDLPIQHGAPLRLKVERQLGYKSTKYVNQITVLDSLDKIKDGKISVAIDYNYQWYAGI